LTLALVPYRIYCVITYTCYLLRSFLTSQGKMEMIQGNLSKVAGAMSGKRRDLDAVSSILQQKLQIQYQQQSQQMSKIDTLQ
jgi:hypothetical protein